MFNVQYWIDKAARYLQVGNNAKIPLNFNPSDYYLESSIKGYRISQHAKIHLSLKPKKPEDTSLNSKTFNWLVYNKKMLKSDVKFFVGKLEIDFDLDLLGKYEITCMLEGGGNDAHFEYEIESVNAHKAAPKNITYDPDPKSLHDSFLEVQNKFRKTYLRDEQWKRPLTVKDRVERSKLTEILTALQYLDLKYKDQWVIPVNASFFFSEINQWIQLNVFVASNGKNGWILQDWTYPKSELLTKPWESFKPGQEGLEELFNHWQHDNYYPFGVVKYSFEIRDGGQHNGTFDTQGRPSDLSVATFLEYLGLAAMVGMMLTAVLIPGGVVVTVLLWSSLGASVGASVIRIRHSMQYQNGTLADNKMDLFNIALCCATAGTVKMGTVFITGARVSLATTKGKAFAGLFIGSNIAGQVQGIIANEELAEQLGNIEANPNLTRMERIDQIMPILAQGALNAAFVAVSFHHSSKAFQSTDFSPQDFLNKDKQISLSNDKFSSKDVGSPHASGTIPKISPDVKPTVPPLESGIPSQASPLRSLSPPFTPEGTIPTILNEGNQSPLDLPINKPSPESMPQPSDVNKHAPPKPAETNDDIQRTVVESHDNTDDHGNDNSEEALSQSQTSTSRSHIIPDHQQFVESVKIFAESLSIPTSDSYLSGGKRGPVLSGVMDTYSGEIFYGINVAGVPSDLHPLLVKRLTNYLESCNGVTPERAGIPGAHSEIVALDKALKSREAATGVTVSESDLPSFQLHNRCLIGRRRVIGIPPRCPNCAGITRGLTVIGGE